MRVLVATTQEQGIRPDDFCWADSGELLRLPINQDSECVCGCHRALVGFDTMKSTTTFKVSEWPINREDFERLYWHALESAGLDPDPDEIKEYSDLLLGIADGNELGTVLRRERDRFYRQVV